MKTLYKAGMLLLLWIGVGLIAHFRGGLREDEPLWWLLLGLPGAIVASGLFLAFAICIVGLYLGAFSRGKRGP